MPKTTRKKAATATSEKKTRHKNKKKEKVIPTTPVEEEVVEEEEELVVEEVPETKVDEQKPVEKKRTRRVVNRDTVLTEFDNALELLEAEVEEIRSSENKTRKGTGVKFLRSFSKRLRGLRNDCARVMKQKRVSNRPKNTQSGFMKPVAISKEMCDFTGWEHSDLKSRVDVTKYICNYIKSKDLQNPSDRRRINPNRDLRKLLKMEKADDDLTYYSLQKKIQHHFASSKNPNPKVK